MLHKNNVYYFIDKFDREEILKLDKNVNIIYRNYNNKLDEKLLIKIKNLCRVKKRKLFLANDLRSVLKLNLNGLYIPSFNKRFSIRNINRKKIEILGSAHNRKEIFIKEKQGVNKIFIAPVFMVSKKKYFLGTSRFNLLSKVTKKDVIALGGINKKNINKLRLLNCSGFASISYLKGILNNKNGK